MAFLVTQQGIASVLASLEYSPDTLKFRFANILQRLLATEEAIAATSEIPTDILVREIWQVTTETEIKQRKKNFSSLKSTVNKDLRALDDQQNPEGLVLNRNNIFEISSEKKDSLLREMGVRGGGDLSAAEEFTSFKKEFSDFAEKRGWNNLEDIFNELTAQQHQVKSLREQVQQQESLIASLASELKNNKKAMAAPLEETAGNRGPTVGGEEEGAKFGKEKYSVSDDEGGEDGEGGSGHGHADGTPEGLKTIKLDEDQVIEEADLEEEAVGGAEGAGQAEGAVEELETIELDEDQVIEEVDLEEEAAGGTEGSGQAEGAAEEFETIELDEDQVIEEVDLEEEAAGGTEGQGQPEGAAEEFETIKLDEDQVIEEVDLEEEKAGGAEGPGLAEGATEELETIELDEDQVIEEVESEEEAAGGAEGAGQAEGAAEEFETIELDEDQAIEEVDLEKEKDRRSNLLEALSEYLDAEEALSQNELLTLDESKEDYLKQILQRFTPRFIKIPAGTYIIGSKNQNHLETPERRVALPAFFIGQVPVTNDLFDLFVRETGYQTDAERTGFGRVFTGRYQQQRDPRSGKQTFSLLRGRSSHIVDGADWRHPHGPESSLENRHNHPVVQVSRADALAFASWAGKRLPTEEEWEAAARGHEGNLYPWGNRWDARRANLEASLNGDLTPVTAFSPQGASPFGILDLLGNVFEWTSSRPAAADGSPRGTGHILKGGCWNSGNEIFTYSRLTENDNFWANTVGFRCAV